MVAITNGRKHTNYISSHTAVRYLKFCSMGNTTARIKLNRGEVQQVQVSHWHSREHTGSPRQSPALLVTRGFSWAYSPPALCADPAKVITFGQQSRMRPAVNVTQTCRSADTSAHAVGRDHIQPHTFYQILGTLRCIIEGFRPKDCRRTHRAVGRKVRITTLAGASWIIHKTRHLWTVPLLSCPEGFCLH